MKSKNFIEPHFQPTSQFPPKNTYHMHTGLFFSSCVTVICVTYPKNILQPHFHGSSRLKKLPFAQRTFLFFTCDYYLCDISKKYFTASLSCRSYIPPLLLPREQLTSIEDRNVSITAVEKLTNPSGASSFLRRPETSRPNLIA